MYQMSVSYLPNLRPAIAWTFHYCHTVQPIKSPKIQHWQANRHPQSTIAWPASGTRNYSFIPANQNCCFNHNLIL